ncbi:MAG: hypothetical protein ABGZ35_27565 [Planctomycetaceae bacterium]
MLRYWEFHAIWIAALLPASVVGTLFALDAGIPPEPDEQVVLRWVATESSSGVPDGPPDWDIIDVSNPRCPEHADRMAAGTVELDIDSPFNRPVEIWYSISHTASEEISLQRTIPAGVDKFRLPYAFHFLNSDAPPYRWNELVEEKIEITFYEGDYRTENKTHTVTLPPRMPSVRLVAAPLTTAGAPVHVFIETDDELPNDLEFKYSLGGSAIEGNHYQPAENNGSVFRIMAETEQSNTIEVIPNSGNPVKTNPAFLKVSVLPGELAELVNSEQIIKCEPLRLPRNLLFRAQLSQQGIAEGKETQLTVELASGAIPEGLTVSCRPDFQGNDIAIDPPMAAFTHDVSRLTFAVLANTDAITFEDDLPVDIGVLVAQDRIPVELTITDATEAVIETLPDTSKVSLAEGQPSKTFVARLAGGVTAGADRQISWRLQSGQVSGKDLLKEVRTDGNPTTEGAEVRGEILLSKGSSEAVLSLTAVSDSLQLEEKILADLTFIRPPESDWTWQTSARETWQLEILDTVPEAVVILVVNDHMKSKEQLTERLEPLEEFAGLVRIVDANSGAPIVYSDDHEFVSLGSNPKTVLDAAFATAGKSGAQTTVMIWVHPEPMSQNPDWKLRPSGDFYLFWIGGNIDGRDQSGMNQKGDDLRNDGIPVVQRLQKSQIFPIGGTDSLMVRRLRQLIK